MSDIIVFISPKFTDADKEKIAESMRIHKIKTTTDPNIATAILEPSLKKTTPKTIGMVLENAPQNLTLADIAQIVIDQPQGQIFKLREDLMANIPEVIYDPTPNKSHHHKNTYPKQSLSRFKSVNNIRNNKFFTRTKHK
ncbi:MAG: hypothetical protein IKM94_04545 [Alphaproteobacteria bacterium]|nr:hypothetical protein [Alphaproteobacteria bacterium]